MFTFHTPCRELLRQGAPEAATPVTPRDLALLIARFSCNIHTIVDAEMRPLGVGIYPLTAMANHACNPSCIQTFLPNGRLDLRTIRTLRPGEEATIAYTELAAPRWERRAQLWEHYLFDIDGGAADSPPFLEVPKRLEHQVAESRVGNGTRHVHHDGCSEPPWPHDGPRDMETTKVEWMETSGRESQRLGGAWGYVLRNSKSPSDVTHAVQSFSVDEIAQPLHGGTGDPEAAEPQVVIHTWGTHAWPSDGRTERFINAYACALILLDGKSIENLPHGHDSGIEAIVDALQGRDKVTLSPGHVHTLRLLELNLKSLISRGDRWNSALRTARELMPLYEEVYPEVWPIKALHMVTLAKLEHLEGNLHAAFSWSKHAASILGPLGEGFEESRVEADRIMREVEAETEAAGRR